MTLKEAYDKWAAIEANKRMALSYRSSIQKCLLEKHGQTKLSLFTDSLITAIFANCKESKEMKAKAASFLMQMLRWVTEYQIDQEYEQTQFEKDGLPREQKPDTQVANPQEAKPAKAPATKKVSQTPKKKGTIGGKRTNVCRPVLQVDANTMEVVARFESASEATRKLGVQNVSQYARKHHQSKGYYFVYEDEREKWGIAPASAESPTTLPAVIAPKPGAMHQVLAHFTDDELIDELISRGWTGDITVTKTRKH